MAPRNLVQQALDANGKPMEVDVFDRIAFEQKLPS